MMKDRSVVVGLVALAVLTGFSSCKVLKSAKSEGAHLPTAEELRISQVFSELRFAQSEETAPSEGWTVLTERYTNPTSRPLNLWFSAEALSYQLETKLGAKLDWDLFLPAGRLATDAGFEPGLHRFSKVPLEVASLVFKSVKGRTIKTLELKALEAALPIQINPGQTFDVEWKVSASEKTQHCTTGEAVSRTIWPCVTPSVPGGISYSRTPWGPTCQRPEDGSPLKDIGELKGVWAVQEYRISGEFTGAVYVSEVMVSQAESLTSAVATGLAASLAPSHSLEGAHLASFAEEWNGSASVEMSSCQGIF